MTQGLILGLILALHIVAIVIWLGGLFFVTFTAAPSVGALDTAAAHALWRRLFSRFFLIGWAALALIIATGVAMVFLSFGGYAHIPNIHRANMVIGIPAIALFAYVYFAPWRRFRRACDRNDAASAAQSIKQARLMISIILTLGLVAAVASAVGRYYDF